MWHMATYAGTGMAIAGLGATYYALTRKDFELEARNHALMEAQSLAGFSDNPDMPVTNIDTRPDDMNYANLYWSTGQVNPGYNRSGMRTASQNFLKAEFEALELASGSTDGLNIIGDNIPRSIRSDDSRSFDMQRIVRRAETDPAIFPGTGSNSSLVWNDEYEMTSRSENFGYVRKIPIYSSRKLSAKALLPQTVNSQSAKSQPSRSRSVFGVETCSQFKFYSEEDIDGPKEGSVNETLTTNGPGSTPSGTNGDNKQSAPTPKEPWSRWPIPISISTSEHRRKIPGKRTRIPKAIPSNPQYAIKSVTRTIKSMTSDGTVTVNPYLTRAEPVSFQLKHPKYFKEPKSCSTTERFQRKAKVRRENYKAIRRCDTTALNFGTTDEIVIPDMNNGEKDSIEFLYPPGGSEKRAKSVCEKGCLANLPDEGDDDSDGVKIPEKEMSDAVLEYTRQLERDMAVASVSDTTFSDEFIPHGPVGSSMFEFGTGTSTSRFPASERVSISNLGPISIMRTSSITNGVPIATFGPISIIRTTTNANSGLIRDNRGFVYNIPADSWMMLPLRLLPGEMVPWGLVFFIPLIIFVLAVMCYIFMLVIEAISFFLAEAGKSPKSK